MRLTEISENYISKLRTDALNLLVRLVAKGDNEIATNSMSDELNKMGHSVNSNSLADLVSFCMVPSFLIFVHYMVVLPELLNFKLLIVLSSFPLVLGAIRLAKYNALREMRDSAEYLGLPTPANAIFVCSSILFTYNIPYRSIVELDSTLYKFLNNFLEPFFITEYMVLLLSIFSSILLMSKINYKKFPLISFRINKKNNIDLIKIIIFLLILGSSVVSKSYDIILLLFISFYIFGNFIKYFFNLIKR